MQVQMVLHSIMSMLFTNICPSMYSTHYLVHILKKHSSAAKSSKKKDAHSFCEVDLYLEVLYCTHQVVFVDRLYIPHPA